MPTLEKAPKHYISSILGSLLYLQKPNIELPVSCMVTGVMLQWLRACL